MFLHHLHLGLVLSLQVTENEFTCGHERGTDHRLMSAGGGSCISSEYLLLASDRVPKTQRSLPLLTWIQGLPHLGWSFSFILLLSGVGQFMVFRYFPLDWKWLLNLTTHSMCKLWLMWRTTSNVDPTGSTRFQQVLISRSSEGRE